MEHPVDVQVLPEPARKALGGPPPLRMMVARGMAPLPPVALVSALYALSFDADEKLRGAADASLEKLPEAVMGGALGSPDLPGAVLDHLATKFLAKREVLDRVLRHPSVLDETLVVVARTCNEAVSELIATNEQRLLRHTPIIEALYFNPATRMSTADRIVELAARNGHKLNIPGFDGIVAALQQQLIPAAGDEPLPSDAAYAEAIQRAEAVDASAIDEDEAGEMVVAKPAEEVEKDIKDMTISEKIRTAMIGSSSQRALLIRSPNRLVAAAVLDSPKITEDEVVKFAASRSVSEDVLRGIAGQRTWTRIYEVKLNLANNPKTPLGIALRLLDHIREGDLKRLAGNKNIPSALRTAVTNLLKKRKK